MKAVILAGGKGTRLGNLTKDIPKPMIPLLGKPLVEYQVELLSRYGFSEIIFVVNHLGDTIEQHFKDGSAFGIKISYFHESEPLGTVGGVKEIEDQLQKDFLVLYGDVMMEMDLNRLLNFHHEKNSEATLVVHPNDHPYDSDLVEIDEDQRVVKVLPKPHPEGFLYHNMVNAAAYVFSPSIFKYLEKGRKADFGKDIFPKIFNQVRMYGYNTPEYLKDMGTPDRLEQVEKDIKSGKVKRRSLAQKQKAIFLDRDGVLNFDTDLIHRPEDFTLFDFTAEAIKKINTSDYLSVITTNQSVVARNLTTIEGLGEIHKKMETELGNAGAKLDAIYYCPHHPHGGYPGENPQYKIECECRKPKPGMIRQASAAFNIDTSQSYMIGDSERDMGAGQAAGCKTVGVMTGHGVKKSSLLPDYFFADLKEAVDFIIDEPYKNLASETLNQVEASDKKPFVISIGGNSRSGKSILAQYLKDQFEKSGYSVLKISLDDWILPKEQRQGDEDVFSNFQTEKLTADLQHILHKKKVTLTPYTSHPERTAETKTYQFTTEDVIIIEGVVALATPALREPADLKIFKKIDENLLQERMYRFYEWKGYSKEETGKLWTQRKTNEYELIAGNEQFGNVVV